jgi:ribosome-associated toxin RatA of RatAB toxin-antitoxin module
MIRKYARIDARPETVRGIFRDVERWPSWMPTIEALEVLERSEDRARVQVRERLLGRVSRRTLQLDFDHQGFVERQIAGRLKRWKTVWRFVDPPTGTGTVVSTLIDIDLGMMRYLVPRRSVQRLLDHFHDEIVSRAEARARRREETRPQTVWGVLPGQELSIRVYETPTELEVWFGERRFVLPAAD